MEEENLPQTLFMPPTTTWSVVKAFLNYKVISLIVISLLCGALYIQQNRIDTYKAKLESQTTKTTMLETDLIYCQSNFNELKLSVENAALESKKLNEQFFDLTIQIEKFNKINRNNSKEIDAIRNSALANTCDDAIKELVDAIEGDK